MAGPALVALIFILNLTVSIGALNGLIFYANILASHRVVFLPFSTPSFATVFISWINLDFGFVVCFFDGMDYYSRTWLQLVFPTYITLLALALFIVLKTLSMAKVSTGKILDTKNAFATLATVLLLNYTKLLRFAIDSFLSDRLGVEHCFTSIYDLPNGTIKQQTVWLLDPSVPYLRGKHIALFLAALIVIILLLLYTGLLLTWHGFTSCLNSKIRSLKVIKLVTAFVEAYTGPYESSSKHGVGLLLVARLVIYLVAALNINKNFGDHLLATVVVVSGLMLLDSRGFAEPSIYKERPLDVIEMLFHFNLVILSAGTLYILYRGGSQIALANTSVSIAFVIFAFIVICQSITIIHSSIKNTKSWKKIEALVSKVRQPFRKYRTNSELQDEENPIEEVHTQTQQQPSDHTSAV